MATITEDYVSFEIAKLLKDKGFDEATNRYYNAQHDQIRTVSDTFLWHWNDEEFMERVSMDGAIAIPTLQMAMKWLREKHLLHISIDIINGGKWKYEIDDISVPFDGGILPKYYCDKSFSSYEEAADDAIKYSLENLI